MARPPKSRTPEIADDANHEALEKAGHDATELGNQLAIIEQRYDVGIPYNKDVYISTLRQYAVETAARVIQIGFMLTQIREHETRDDYQSAVERIGFSARFAQRAIQATEKLRHRPGLIKLGSSKALELLAEDDEALDALENGGTLAGATLDEIDCMTVRELRDALRRERDERAEEKADDVAIIKAKEDRINKLLGRSARSKQQAVNELAQELHAAAINAASYAGQMIETADAIDAKAAEFDEEISPEVSDAIQKDADLICEWLRKITERFGA